jgi:hypothetical protein
MKKSLTKILARMAKDGDVETVAEILEEMLEPENAPETPSETAEENAAENTETPAAEEPQEVAEDEVTLADVISRLDQIIALLTPVAQDEEGNDPAEEIAEAVEEAVEAALESEIAVEAGDPDIVTGEEIGEMVEEILDPVSEVVEENTDQCGEEEEQEVIASGDALRAALRAVAPALMKMPKKQRTRVCSDIAARLRGKSGRRGADGIYAALADTRRIVRDPKELGRRIMASRSANKPRT